ncbi:phospholipase A [Marinospirillum perlucidum]|uniref:phospholipase A n=1 Tax=Marinospirillum perlucidum TaxID=1982602 RepID=UPI000DF36DF3|nr:phospholipase A [Marinospirillum perlucidum]
MQLRKTALSWLLGGISTLGLTGQVLAAQAEEAASPQEEIPLEERLDNYRSQLRELYEDYSQELEAYPFDYSDTQLEKRLQQELRLDSNPFAFTPHQRNYLLPFSYTSDTNEEGFDAITQDADLQPVEIKFQFSLKVPVMQQWLSEEDSLHLAFTQTSWWQAYHRDASRPFRESNYQPEIFYTHRSDLHFLGLQNNYNRLGIAHESNGRTNPQSRSWNYIYWSTALAKGRWMLEFSPRYKLPRITGEANNPDIEDYLGYFDLTLAYANWKQEWVVTTQGNFETEKGGLQLDWSFPILGRLRGLLQVYGGYGESLVDYNHENYRISLGIQFTNQLFGEN